MNVRSPADVVVELRRVPLAERLLLGQSASAAVAIACAAIAAVAAWLLWSPGHLYSREMTWDLLFNLEGAWQIEQGQIPHVDFHEPLGMLGFTLTSFGFHVVGFTPRAFLVGEMVVLVAILATAIPVAARRLAPAPAVLFTAYVALLILQPANIGDAPNAYSFAMSYNRWGWAALSTLCLLLFVDPRRGRDSQWDEVVTALLCVFLFYLKITFAAAAVGALAVAMVLMRRLRRHWGSWLVVVGGLALIAAAPVNRAYIREIWIYANSGYARIDLAYLVNIFIANRAEYTLQGAVLGILFWLWQAGRVRLEVVVASFVVTAIGLFVLTQNAQFADIPLGIIICLMLYNALAITRPTSLTPGPHASMPSGLRTLLIVVLLWPALTVFGSAKVFAGYYHAATGSEVMLAPSTTNLRGLAVPPLDHEVPIDLARMGYSILSSTRPSPLRDPLTQAEYVESLVEAASLLAGHPQKVLVIDQVNPMPYVLGYPPPRGSLLWMGPDAPPRVAGAIFDDVDVVLVPKYSTYAPTTALMLRTYYDYLQRHFPDRTESARWTILRRTAAASR